jgi:hypothetical protein
VTAGGWIFLVLGWGFVLGLTAFSLSRTLRKP